jgi:GT2 family glycosyltransferase
MRITISILTHNRISLLKDVLNSLSIIKFEHLEIIVIDNCSEDDTGKVVIKQFPNVIYVKLPSNIGASARNVGIKNATGDIIVMLDDDILGIDDAALQSLCALFKENSRIGAVNFKVTDYYSGDICNWVHHRIVTDNDKEFPTYEITEGAVAFRKSALEKSGYYPEYFFLSHEGPDLALRIIDAGYDVIYSNKISVRHKHSNLGRHNWTNYYYDTRNQFWFAVRNLPVLYAMTYLFRGLCSMMIYSIRDRYFFYWLKAVRDGLKGIKRALSDRRVISKETMSLIKEVDRCRPNLMYMMKNKLFTKGVRL